MPIDSLLQSRIGSLHAGVSRQAPLLRSPSQMDEIVNFMPSVDIGGLADRVGTTCIANVAATPYQQDGSYMFRTTDGQRWVFIRRADQGYPDIRNLTNGAPATVTVGPFAQSYINTGSSLKFITMDDTVLVVNTAINASFVDPATPVNTTRAYISIVKLSSSNQTFYVNSTAGSGSVLYSGTTNVQTRDWVAQQLMQAIIAGMPGITVWRNGSVLKLEGTADQIASLSAGNDWDSTALVLIKGRVTALTDLPSTFFPGEALMVDLNAGDPKTAYWVTYDATTNTYKESTWLDGFATGGNWDQSTMPMRVHQTGSNSFEIMPVDWVARSVGDDNSNAPAPFNGQPITDVALWKGRLWFASGSWIVSSQPDDLFNFWQGSAREVVASDPVKAQVDANYGNVSHILAFRDNLMVFLRGAQLAVDGSQQLVTPQTVSLGLATSYDVDEDCPPAVIGTVIQYTGSQEGRSVLWEYQYLQAMMNNYSEDLSKHIPRYCPGSVRRIMGSSQSGRSFLWTPLDPATLYVQTSYWQQQQRVQNAWNKVTFSQMTSIWYHWVDEETLYVLGQNSVGYLSLVTCPIDANLGENPATDLRIDMQQQVQITWNATLSRSEIVLPDGYYQMTDLVLCIQDPTGGWYTEYDIQTTYDGSEWIGYFAEQVTPTFGTLGLRISRYFRFSAFYPSVDNAQTPMGRYQVHRVIMDCLRSGDFTATVSRPDRGDMTVSLSPRTIGDTLTPNMGDNQTYSVPFNSRGNAATLTVSTDSSAPMVVTGYTLAARFSNLFGNP